MANKTFIVQASLAIAIYDRQNIFIEQATGPKLSILKIQKKVHFAAKKTNPWNSFWIKNNLEKKIGKTDA